MNSRTIPASFFLIAFATTLAIASAQTIVPHPEGGWVTQGLPYDCRISANGALASLVVDGFDYVGGADGAYLAKGKDVAPVTSVRVASDALRLAVDGGQLVIRFLPTGPEFTVSNTGLPPGAILRLRFAPSIARIKPLGRSNEPPMPLRAAVHGALRFIAPNGSSLTFGESDSYHLGAACTALPAGEIVEVRMPYVYAGQTISFQLALAESPLLEDAIRVAGRTDREDNTFWDDGPVELHVTATNVSADTALDAELVVRLKNYLTREIVRDVRKPLSLAAAASETLTWQFRDLEPMLYTADIWIVRGNDEGFCGSPRFVYHASQILPPPLPEDFDDFWARTLREQAEIPLDLQMTKVREEANHVLYKFSFAGLLGHRCYGWLTVPTDTSTKRPATLVLPPAGMRDQPIPMTDGMVSMAININTVDVGLPADAYDWRTWPAPYLVTGILDKNYYTLRFSYAAIARAYEVLAAHEAVDPTQIHVQGSSQGGGLTIIAAGLIPDAFVDATARKPGLCRLDWNLQYLNPPFFPIGSTEASKPVIQQTLKYFLPSHFARRITCPIDISLGIYDDVTPGVSVFCAYNAIPGDTKTLKVDANAGH